MPLRGTHHSRPRRILDQHLKISNPEHSKSNSRLPIFGKFRNRNLNAILINFNSFLNICFAPGPFAPLKDHAASVQHCVQKGESLLGDCPLAPPVAPFAHKSVFLFNKWSQSDPKVTPRLQKCVQKGFQSDRRASKMMKILETRPAIFFRAA